MRWYLIKILDISIYIDRCGEKQMKKTKPGKRLSMTRVGGLAAIYFFPLYDANYELFSPILLRHCNRLKK